MAKKKAPRYDVVLLVDEETGEYGRGGRFIPERNDVEAQVLKALRRRYARVEVVPFSPRVVATVERLRALRPRMVVNLTEWVEGDRKLDAAITGLLEIMKLRYTGTGPDGLRLSRDKALSKSIVAGLGIDVPRYFVAQRGERVPVDDLTFPLIVKPQFGDGSDAITKHSVVRGVRTLRARVRSVHARLKEPAVCEQFIGGRDLYVGLLGDGPRVLPPVELVVRSRHRLAPQFATYRLKNDPRYRARWGVYYRRARLGTSQLRKLRKASRHIFHALNLRDYARLDFRLAEDGRLYFIEANPNPDLDPHSLNRSGCFATLPYPRLIETIVESARNRRGM
jgi:D-alanine-D-alanine ligase